MYKYSITVLGIYFSDSQHLLSWMPNNGLNKKNGYHRGIRISVHQQNTHEISRDKENTSQTGSDWLIHAHSGLISSFFANVHTPSHKSFRDADIPKSAVCCDSSNVPCGRVHMTFPNFHWWVMQWCSCKLPPFWASWWSSWCSCSAGFNRWRRCSRRSNTARLHEWEVQDFTSEVNQNSKHETIPFRTSTQIGPFLMITIKTATTRMWARKKCQISQVAQGSPLALSRSWRLEDSQAVNVSKFDHFLNIWQQKTSTLCWIISTFSVDSECKCELSGKGRSSH